MEKSNSRDRNEASFGNNSNQLNVKSDGCHQSLDNVSRCVTIDNKSHLERANELNEEAKDKYNGFNEISLCCLTKKSKLRRLCLHAITSPWFERLTMLVILTNCITLGSYRPCEDASCSTRRCIMLQYFDNLIFIYFTIEMVIKIIAMGFSGSSAYLDDSWNRLDFFIVLAGFVEYFLMTENLSLSAIRTIRVLRPLRAINRVPSMRILVMLLLDTLPMLGNVLLLCFFVFFIFGIVGVQLWKGVLRNRCYLDRNMPNYSLIIQHMPKYYMPTYKDSFICTKSGGETTCDDVPPFVKNNHLCKGGLELLGKETNQSCINWNRFYTKCDTSESNPFKGSISFDNIGYAWITIFQIISLESWVSIMYYVQDAHSFWNWIYFVILIVIGSFFMINLCLVVIATQFSETKKRETERMASERIRFSKSTSTLFNDTDPGTCWEEFVKYIDHLCRRLKRKLIRLKKQFEVRRQEYKQKREHKSNLTHTYAIAKHSPKENHFYFKTDQASLAPNRHKDDDSKSKLSFLLSAPKASPEVSDITGLSLFERKNSFLTVNEHQKVTNQSVSNTNLYCLYTDEGACTRQSSFKSTVAPKTPKSVKIQDDARTKRRCFFLIIITKKLKNICERLVSTKLFSRGILFAILINTLSMGIEHHNQPEMLTNVVEIINYIFIVVFLFEMIAKLLAYGIIEYLKNLYNLFDGLIVILSWYELLRSFNKDKNYIETSDLSVLRTFRLLRIIKLVRFMPALKRQLIVMLKTIDNVATFFSLLMLFIFIFSILGMNLFGCKFCSSSGDGMRRCERKNFDSLLWATITVFQILTQEDWNEVMYNGMEKLSAPASLYFIVLMTFGNYVLFNLLVAILVEGFSSGDGSEKNKKSLKLTTEEPLKQLVIPKIAISEYGDSFRKKRQLPLMRQLSLDSAWKRIERGKRRKVNVLRQNSLKMLKVMRPIETEIAEEEMLFTRVRDRRSSFQRFSDLVLSKRKTEEDSCLINNESNQTMIETQLEQDVTSNNRPFEQRVNYSLFLFSPENKFRKMVNYVTSQKWFDYMILIIIALNCITLAMERPTIPAKSIERQILTYSNYVFTFIFSLEMCLKVVAQGFCLGSGSYLSSGWNRIDCFLVLFSLFDIIINLTFKSSPKIFGVLRVFRLLRTLRPLRVISRAPGLKLVVETLFTSLRPIGNIVLICCTFFIIFGILGVQLFKGKFYHCSGENVKNENIITREDCLRNSHNKWINSQYNFDNLGYALMALFVLASKDGWVQIMYMGIDAVGVDKQPKENYNEWMLLYFISFLLLVGFFVLNMFVGVVVENFHKCREAQEREEKARKMAKRAMRFEEKGAKLKEIPYYAHYSRSRRLIHDICISKYFDLLIAAVIGLNVVTMSLEFYMMPSILEDTLDYFNILFTIIFLLEAIIKITALGLVKYIKEKWNQLDVLIVIFSIMGILFDRLSSQKSIPLNPTIIRVMRVLRIARVLKLLKMANGIRALLDTVIQALPQVGNLGLLFFLLFFIFATLGVELFGRLDCEELTSACDGISKHANFQNFGMSFLTLFRIATGDNWNGLMKDALRENVLCIDDSGQSSNHCLASLIAPIYFVIFVLMAQFVLVNVVIAVLMKHLDDSNKMSLIDDAASDEDMEKQIEVEARNNIYDVTLVNDVYNKLDYNDFKTFTKQSSLPPNFTFEFDSFKENLKLDDTQARLRVYN